MRGAAHVLLHQSHAGGGLDVEAATVEDHTLAHQRDDRMVRAAPGDLDEARGPRRVGGAANRMNHRVAGFQQRLAGGDGDFSAVRLRNSVRGGFQFVRPHVVGRRIHQVAGQIAGSRYCPDFLYIRAARRLEPYIPVLGRLLVAGEPIAADQPGKGELARVNSPGHLADAVVARGKPRGQPPQRHGGGRCGVPQADTNFGQLALGRRGQGEVTGLSLEFGEVGRGFPCCRRRRGLVFPILFCQQV